MPQLRIVSYNIQALAQGAQGVIDTLARLDADVIGLQEVDRDTERSGEIAQAQVLAEALKLHVTYAAAMPFDGGEFGLAILSRGPLSQPRIVRLPRFGQEEPRIALFATCELPDGTRVRLGNTHLAADWRAKDPQQLRAAQADHLARVLAEEAAIGAAPLFIIGDFNCGTSTEAYSTLCNVVRPLHADLPTYPATAPQESLDHVFFVPSSRDDRRELQVRRVHVDFATTSDHRALVADVELVDPSFADR